MLKTFTANTWDTSFTEETKQQAIQTLENGHILYFPKLPFNLSSEENFFLTPDHADPRSKNIGYFTRNQRLWGVQRLADAEQIQLKIMLERFAQYSLTLIHHLLPHYTAYLTIGRTSFRPVQISQRKTSYKKDDKRLHIDAFPSSPNQGKRILRVFCNINPHNEPRVWRIGEPFENVAQRFLPKIKKPFPSSAQLLKFL